LGAGEYKEKRMQYNKKDEVKVAIRNAIVSSCKRVFKKGKQFYSFPTTTLSKIVQKATDEIMKIQAGE